MKTRYQLHGREYKVSIDEAGKMRKREIPEKESKIIKSFHTREGMEMFVKDNKIILLEEYLYVDVHTIQIESIETIITGN